MSDFTFREFLEDIAVQSILTNISNVTDPLSVLSESNIVYTKANTQVRDIDSDGNVFSPTDEYGDAINSDYIANYEDRERTIDSYDFPTSEKIAFEIPRDQFHLFGLNQGILDRTVADVESGGNVNFDILGGALEREFGKMGRKARVRRTGQVQQLFTEMGAATLLWQKPLGLEVADEAATRDTFWAYTNILNTELTPESYAAAVNILAGGQLTAYNERYGSSKPMMLLHASDYALAEQIHLPNLSVNINYKTAGDSIEVSKENLKAVGVWNDTVNPQDWILLGQNHQIYRKAFLTPLGNRTAGLSARAYFHPTRGSLVIEVYDRSIMVVDSPIDIVKSMIGEPNPF